MFTIYSADVTGNPGNCSYPHKHVILDEDSLKAAMTMSAPNIKTATAMAITLSAATAFLWIAITTTPRIRMTGSLPTISCRPFRVSALLSTIVATTIVRKTERLQGQNSMFCFQSNMYRIPLFTAI